MIHFSDLVQASLSRSSAQARSRLVEHAPKTHQEFAMGFLHRPPAPGPAQQPQYA